MRIFLDTNIVVDFFDIHRQQHAQAVQLVYDITKNDHQIIISEDMLSTIFYLCPDKQTTLWKFKFLQKNWTIVAFKKAVINDSINLSIKDNLDLEDTLQCLCAKYNKCDYLISVDKKFIDCGIKIVNYEQFMQTIK